MNNRTELSRFQTQVNRQRFLVITPALRDFIMRVFSDGELETLCFDYFRDISDEFTAGMLKSRKVQLLIQYCDSRGLTPNLLVALQRERPIAYAQNLARHVPISININVDAPTEPQPKLILPERNPRQIFLCHAHADSEAAQQLAQALTAEGWQVWISPHSIQPGEKWVDAVQRGLDESSIFLLLLSQHSLYSRWVKTETSAAIALEHTGHMQFVVAEVEPCQHVPSLWSIYQRVMVHGLLNDTARTAECRTLLKVLRASVPGGANPKLAGSPINPNATLPSHIALPALSTRSSAPSKPAKLPAHESGLNLSERRRRAESWQLRAYAHANSRNYKRAVAACNRALNYSPKPGSVHADLARIHGQFGNRAAELASWGRAIALDAGQALYRVKRARLYERNGQIDLAIEDYTCAIHLRPDMAEYVFARALLYERKRDGHAMADFNRAIHLDRHDGTYYVARAQYHHQRGSYDKAVADYTRALDILKAAPTSDPTQRVSLLFARANSHYCKCNYSKAITDYTRVLELDRKHGEAYYWRGMSFKLGGEAHWAQHDFQDSLRHGCVLGAAEVVGASADASMEALGHTGYGSLAQAAFNKRDTQSWPAVPLRA